MGIVLGRCGGGGGGGGAAAGRTRGRRRDLRSKIRELEEQKEEGKRAREAELRAFAGREEEWRRERRRLRDDAARLRVRMKEIEEEKLAAAAAAAAAAAGEQEERMRDGKSREQLLVVERMKEEQKRREEAVEKWKQLYLAIKAELDDLIQRTHHQGERFCWGAAEQQQGMIEALQRELKAKEETVESLRLKISSMEKEGVRREREIDILRQSLRILSYSKRNHRSIRRSLSRGLRI